MMKILSLLFWTILSIVGFTVTLFAQVSLSDVPRKKMIELGWDIPNTAFLRGHHEEMQRTTPFDGVMIALEAVTPEGKKISSQGIMDPTPWDPAFFEPAVADLKACRWTSWTDRFIRFNFTPGTVDWNDENGWKVVCDKTALCAKIARDTGIKGLAVDFEPYGRAMFQYDPDAGRSFSETKTIVRNRGRQWMRSLAAEYPEMVLFTLFILDFVPKPSEDDHIDDLLEPAHYGLLPAFFNGMLDALPPKMKIVDGCESGYYHNGIDEFSRRALAIQSVGGPAFRLIDPENRQKYAAQVQVGFGFYLDMYVNPEGSTYYRGPKEGGTRLDRLAENLSAAKETCDEYIWVYGEKRRWWPLADKDAPWEHWETAMPGMTQTIRMINSPEDVVRNMLKNRIIGEEIENLVLNCHFEETKSDKDGLRFPESWQSWQHDPLGTFSWEDGHAQASKVKWGCFMQTHPVKSGEYYYVSVDCRKQGASLIGLRIRWQDHDKKWTQESEDRQFAFGLPKNLSDNRSIENGWLRAEGLVRVPEKVGFLQIQMGVRNQQTDEDTVWFDNAVLVRVE